MSLLVSFLGSHLLPALEAAFVAHEPEMQEALVNEVATMVEHLGGWVESKLHKKED